MFLGGFYLPTIGPDVPLVFDVYDTWNERSVGGCTYHVAHPGGRNYVTFPVNSYEAEARRINRFWEYNHTPRNIERVFEQDGQQGSRMRYVSQNYQAAQEFAPTPMEPDPEFPLTLDLRKVTKR